MQQALVRLTQMDGGESGGVPPPQREGPRAASGGSTARSSGSGEGGSRDAHCASWWVAPGCCGECRAPPDSDSHGTVSQTRSGGAAFEGTCRYTPFWSADARPIAQRRFDLQSSDGKGIQAGNSPAIRFALLRAPSHLRGSPFLFTSPCACAILRRMARFVPDAAYHFKRGPRGEILFFPRGSFGRGYVVPDGPHAEAIDHRRKVLYRWAAFCTNLVVVLRPFSYFGWSKLWWNLTALCIAVSVTTAVADWRLYRMVMELPMSDTRLRLPEVLAQAKAELVSEARDTPWWLRTMLVVGMVGLVVALVNLASR